eukprot:1049917-Amphidinium_carterae.1
MGSISETTCFRYHMGGMSVFVGCLAVREEVLLTMNHWAGDLSHISGKQASTAGDRASPMTYARKPQLHQDMHGSPRKMRGAKFRAS